MIFLLRTEPLMLRLRVSFIKATGAFPLRALWGLLIFHIISIDAFLNAFGHTSCSSHDGLYHDGGDSVDITGEG